MQSYRFHRKAYKYPFNLLFTDTEHSKSGKSFYNFYRTYTFLDRKSIDNATNAVHSLNRMPETVLDL